MGTWNYRVINFGRHKALHEVHYDDEGSPVSWTEEPATFGCDEDEGPSSITSSLAMAAYDAARLPVLNLRGDKLVSADVISRDEFTPDRLMEASEQETIRPAREIALRVRKKMMAKLDDDVIGRITEAHVVFGTACAYEALSALPEKDRSDAS